MSEENKSEVTPTPEPTVSPAAKRTWSRKKGVKNKVTSPKAATPKLAAQSLKKVVKVRNEPNGTWTLEVHNFTQLGAVDAFLKNKDGLKS